MISDGIELMNYDQAVLMVYLQGFFLYILSPVIVTLIVICIYRSFKVKKDLKDKAKKEQKAKEEKQKAEEDKLKQLEIQRIAEENKKKRIDELSKPEIDWGTASPLGIPDELLIEQLSKTADEPQKLGSLELTFDSAGNAHQSGS